MKIIFAIPFMNFLQRIMFFYSWQLVQFVATKNHRLQRWFFVIIFLRH
jgi:hypothetical protein